MEGRGGGCADLAKEPVLQAVLDLTSGEGTVRAATTDRPSVTACGVDAAQTPRSISCSLTAQPRSAASRTASSSRAMPAGSATANRAR